MTSVFKNSVLILCLSTAALGCFISCDKDKDDDPKPKTKLELLQQKWNLVKSYDTTKYFFGGPDSFTEYTGKSEDYFTFGQNDTLVRSYNGNFWKDFYKFNDSMMLVYNVQGIILYKIWDLTDSTLELYYRVNMNARGDSYIASHFYLKR